MSHEGLTSEELQAEIAIALPDKEVVSILDLNVDVDVLLDAASPIDLAVSSAVERGGGHRRRRRREHIGVRLHRRRPERAGDHGHPAPGR